MTLFCSYSVTVANDKLRDNILSIPCSGEKIAQAVSQNLNMLFPDSIVSIEEFQGFSILDRLRNKIMNTNNNTPPQETPKDSSYVATTLVEEELEKELFAI